MACHIFHRFTLILALVWASLFPSQMACANRSSDLRLVPYPKEIVPASGLFSLNSENIEIFVPKTEEALLGAILIEEMKRAGFPEPKITGTDNDFRLMILRSSQPSVLSFPALPLQVDEDKTNPEEAYAIAVTPEAINCIGRGNAGLYYAVQTLCQLIRANRDENGNLPCLTIRDWPSMKYRCFQDDLTRGPSPHLETLYKESELGSQLKHNMFTYYMENQFEFKKHPKISPKDGTLTQEEFQKWVEHAAKCHLIVLGNLQSFGHHGKILAIPEYTHLGEEGYILSPTVEEVYSFLDDRYCEVMPLVPFAMFNVCCDETWDLARSGPSKELADQIGVGGVYVKHILRVYELLKKYDKRMLMWGDIIIKHPDKLEQIPKDVVMMCWDYAARPDFSEFIKPFSDSGYEFFVCPGQSNWSVMMPLIDQYTVNIRNFVRDGQKYGAIGMLNTGWEDDGEAIHGYNWHAIAWGAECSWNASKTELADFNKRIGPVLFGAKGEEFGQAMELLAQLQISPALGSGYNSRFWERDFLPNKPAETIEKNAEQILELVRPAIELLETTKQKALVNASLLDSYLLGARRMELIATRMLDGLDAAQKLAVVGSLDLTDPEQRKLAIRHFDDIEKLIVKNRNAHGAMKNEFVRIWNSESKPYSLDRVTKKYDELDGWFADLQKSIEHARTELVGGKNEVELPEFGLNPT